jgi:predicted metal-dependent hydrolase
MRQTRALRSSPKPLTRLDDIHARVEVRRHPTARRMTLRVSRTRRAVIVTIPLQCDLDEAGSFLSRHIDWVRERLDSLPDPMPFQDGSALPFRGEPHRIVFTGAKQTRIVELVSIVGQRPEIRVPGTTASAPRRLREWLFEQAKCDLERSTAVHCKRLGVKAKRVAVRDQASRWGSCSTTRVLSFSWRLVLAPPHILDYVAAHEAAHLAEMNHGPRFWALVKTTSPEFEMAKRWLQIYGLDLHRYGAGSTKST